MVVHLLHTEQGAGSSPAVTTKVYALMAELVDAPDLGSGIERCESSSLS